MDDVQVLTIELEQAYKQIERLQRRLQESQEALTHETDIHVQAVDAILAEKARIEKQSQWYEAILQEQSSKIYWLERRQGEICNLLDGIEDRYDEKSGLKQIADELRRQNAELTEKVALAEEKAKFAMDKYFAVIDHLLITDRENEELRSKVSSLSYEARKNAQDQEDIASLRKKNEALIKKVADLDLYNKQIAALQSQLDESQAHCHEYHKTQVQLKKRIEKLENKE